MRRVRFRHNDHIEREGRRTDQGIEYGGQVYDPADVTVLPPTEPSKIVGVSTNTYDLVEDEEAQEKYDLEMPDRPYLFLKTPNTLVGHGGTVTLLPDDELDWEGELGVVIGETCRNVTRESAMDVVAGFTCVNDITNHSDLDRYAVRFKSFDNAAPVGPVVASTDLVPEDATIEVRVNGRVEQRFSRSSLIFSVPEIIEETTAYMTLNRGDVLTTGTGTGVGAMTDGDRVEVEVEGVGTLEHGVEASPRVEH